MSSLFGLRMRWLKFRWYLWYLRSLHRMARAMADETEARILYGDPDAPEPKGILSADPTGTVE
jgi:hypothetical protein